MSINKLTIIVICEDGNGLSVLNYLFDGKPPKTSPS